MSKTVRVGLILVLLAGLGQLLANTQVAYAVPTWTTPVRLTSNQNLDLAPVILELQDGRVLLVWSSFKTDTELYSKFHSPSTGWSAETRLTNNPENDVAPDMAQMPNGTLLIAWVSERSGNKDVYLARTDGTTITGETRISTATESDSLPAIVAARNGTIWIFWVRFSTIELRYDIYYRVLTNGFLGPETLLTPVAGLNSHPSAAQTKDGRIWLVWSRQANGFNFEIFSRYYDGATWTGEQQITNNNDSDEDPEIVQDRSGDLWIFWAREFPLPAQQFQDELMYQRSTNGGASWLAEVRLTSDPSGGEKNDNAPSVSQVMSDKSLWMAYMATDVEEQWEVWLLKYGPIPGRDVGIPWLTASSYRPTRGTTTTISVKVQNYGDDPETVQLDISVRNTTTTRLVLVSLTIQPGQFTIYQYAWNTMITPAKYRLSTTLTSIVPAESSPNLAGDNSIQDGIIHVRPPGDVNDDGRVNIFDAVSFGQAYHSRPPTGEWDPRADIDGSRFVDLTDAAIFARAYHTGSGDANWDPRADFNGSGYVDIVDAAILGRAYGSGLGDPNWNGAADFTGNRYVDIFDAAILGFWYGTVT